MRLLFLALIHCTIVLPNCQSGNVNGLCERIKRETFQIRGVPVKPMWEHILRKRDIRRQQSTDSQIRYSRKDADIRHISKAIAPIDSAVVHGASTLRLNDPVDSFESSEAVDEFDQPSTLSPMKIISVEEDTDEEELEVMDTSKKQKGMERLLERIGGHKATKVIPFQGRSLGMNRLTEKRLRMQQDEAEDVKDNEEVSRMRSESMESDKVSRNMEGKDEETTTKKNNNRQKNKKKKVGKDEKEDENEENEEETEKTIKSSHRRNKGGKSKTKTSKKRPIVPMVNRPRLVAAEVEQSEENNTGSEESTETRKDNQRPKLRMRMKTSESEDEDSVNIDDADDDSVESEEKTGKQPVKYYYPPKVQVPLPSCFFNPSGYVCCNLKLNNLIEDTYEKIRSKKTFSACNIAVIAKAVQKESEKMFQHKFETVVALGDFAQNVHFSGDFVCKLEIDGKYLMAYGTPHNDEDEADDEVEGVKDVEEDETEESSETQDSEDPEQNSKAKIRKRTRTVRKRKRTPLPVYNMRM